MKALLLRSQLFLVTSAALFILWTVFSRLGVGGFFFFIPDIETFSGFHYPYLLALVLLFAVSYRMQAAKILALNILGFYVWFAFALAKWDAGGIQVLALAIIFGVFLLLLAVVHIYVLKFPREFGLPYSGFGAMSILVSTYLLSFSSLLNRFHDPEAMGEVSIYYWVFIGGITLASALGSFFVFSMKDFIPFVRYGFLGLTGLVVFTLLFLFFPAIPEGVQFERPLYAYQTFNPYTLVWNVILAAEIIGIIILGYFTHERRYVNIGILFFVLLVMSRYFDVFSLYFGTYASFIVGGLLFIFLGYFLERFRKKLLQKIENRRETSLPVSGGNL